MFKDFGRWWQRLSRLLYRPWRRRPAVELDAEAVWRGLRAGQSGVETVLGLPHALARPLLQRHFAGDARPSTAAFAATGRDGFWTLPAPHPHVNVRVLGDPTGRLVRGEVWSCGPWAGVWLTSDWSPYDERPLWRVEIRASEASEERRARLSALTACVEAAGWCPETFASIPSAPEDLRAAR